MASNYSSGEVHALLQRILSSQEYSFDRLSKENKDNHLQILDQFDKQVQQKSSIQIDNTVTEDTSGNNDYNTGERFPLELQNRMQQFQENNPDSSLLRRSMHQGKTNQDGPQLPLGTKNQEQEYQRGIRRPVREEIPVSKQSPNYLANAGDIKELEERLLESDDRYSELGNTYNTLKLRFDDLFRDNSAKDGRMSELAEELDAMKISDVTKGKFLEMKENENMQNEKLIQRLQKEKSDLQEKLSQDMFSKSEENSQKLLHGLLQEKTSFNTRIESFQRKSTELGATVNDLQIRLRDSQTQCSKAIESRDSFFARCESQTNELSDQRNTRQAMERAIQEKEHLIKRLQQDNSELKTSVETYQEQGKLLQSDIAQKEIDLDSIRTKNTMLSAELEVSKEMLTKLHHDSERDRNLHRSSQYNQAYTPGGYSSSPYVTVHPRSGPISSTLPPSSSTPSGYYNDPNH